MKKKIKSDPLEFIRTEHGIKTFEEIARLGDHYRVYPCLLNDGGEVGLTEEIAKGVLLIRDNLNPKNQESMNALGLLELLHIYCTAVEEDVLTPSKLLTVERK